ncbi:sigma-70 family RNA polymerase sigma factor [Nocardia sp. NBC_01377]|uniref:sigma-70 family RNA polymerase sigma factor n=1 Tax=Nocardia sp. NBC_01377 TaxID=2903595 RepID=UPI00324C0132
MTDQDVRARRFEAERDRLRAVAYRMLGSAAEAEDAVQESWLRLAAADSDAIENLNAWLTTVVSRICLDMLRARATRREDPLERIAELDDTAGVDPETEAVLVDSVGRALLVVLARLGPDERIAFVLHDMFAVPFDRIGPVVGRSAATAKKLASRARRRVHGPAAAGDPERVRERRVVEAFLAAARGGDLDALVAVLAPDVVRTADLSALRPGMATEVRGADAVAEETVVLRLRARFAVAAWIDNAPGVVLAPGGRLLLALRMTFDGDRISGYDVVADPRRLRTLEIAVLPDP